MTTLGSYIFRGIRADARATELVDDYLDMIDRLKCGNCNFKRKKI